MISESAYHRMVFGMLFCEWLIIWISGAGFSGLAGNGFFSLGVDPLAWLPFVTGFPQWLTGHAWVCLLSDAFIAVGILVALISPMRSGWGKGMMLACLLWYLTITAYLGHRNFQTGIFLVWFPYIFAKQQSKQMAWEALRYFVLFFYFSAAVFKIWEGQWLQPQHMSNILKAQFIPYYLEGQSGLRLSVNQFLANRPGLGALLFNLSVLAELLPVLGFFTRRYDKLIGFGLIAFHLANWFLMDIAPIGQLSLLILFFIRKIPFQQPVSDEHKTHIL